MARPTDCANLNMDAGTVKDGVVAFRTAQGIDVQATLLHLTRFDAAFELPNAETTIRASEALEGFVLFLRDQPVYSGRAVVREAVNTGTATICSVMLDDISFENEFLAGLGHDGHWGEAFADCLRQWQAVGKVLPEFKVAIADIQTFLIDCRRWMELVELNIRSSPRPDRVQREREVVDHLTPQVIPAMDCLFEKFELLAAGLTGEQRPVHRSYIQRHLHPIVLCAPFAYRTYRKPLGYAGDYEMVNMMLRDPREGSSLFAKVFNVWLLHQGSAKAHRNRVSILERRLVEETAAAVRAGRKARILTLGCGPAWEVQQFVARSELSNQAEFTLMDFNEETLQHAAQALRQRQQEHRRNTSFDLVKRSVQQLLKDVVRADGIAGGKEYDFIYCAGLFDYLPDRTCKRLMGLFYQSLAPGGLALITNVAPLCPNRGSLELILDWHLIYRDALKVAALRPDDIPADSIRIQSDDTGVNVFFETRKD
jgi:extracellular factor (EF) 3-hydroxypalmitic acid methyl ester biosynthesis protein